MDSVVDQVVLAFRHYVEGLTYEQISSIYGISQATISRRIAEAQKRGIIETRTQLHPPAGHLEDVLRAVRHESLEKWLLAKLNERGAGLRQVIVCTGDLDPTQEKPDSHENGNPRIKRVGVHAAHRLAEHILALDEEREAAGEIDTRRLRVGVNWGWTMLHMSRHFLEFAPARMRVVKHLSVSGLAGVFWFDSMRDPRIEHVTWASSSSTCAQNLLDAFEPGEQNYIHRVRVPALMSDDLLDAALKDIEMDAGKTFSRSDEHGRVSGHYADALDSAKTAEILRRFCISDPGFQSVYGSKPIFPSSEQVEQYIAERTRAWQAVGQDRERERDAIARYGNIARYDMLITGMSALQGDSALLRCYKEEQEGVAEHITEENLCGDIVTHLFTEEGVVPRRGAQHSPWASRINARAIGPWPEDLIGVAEKHREKSCGGVLLVCSGHTKAKPLLIAVTKLRVANEICIDTNLAFRLMELLGMAKNDIFQDFPSITAWGNDDRGSAT